jgi:hypothetical protein
LSKKLSPFKVASAAFAGLLVLSSGLAAAGACLSDSSTPEQAAVVTSGETDLSLIAQPGTEVEDHDADDIDDNDADEIDDDKAVNNDHQGDDDAADEVEIEDGDDDHGDDVTVGDDADDDQGEVESPARPETHGSLVSSVAKNNDAKAASEGNHGEAVSAAAHSAKPAHDGDDDQDEVTPPAEGTGSQPTIGDDDDDQDEVEVDDDDQGEDDDDQGDGHDGELRQDRNRHDDEDED